MAGLRVWAPAAQAVVAVVGADEQAMRREQVPAGDPGRAGWWVLDLPPGGEPVDYAFRIDGGAARPDPRSPWQPEGVHGYSRTVDHSAFQWTDGSWRGRAMDGSVCYELHIGTFTSTGTFDAAIARLDHLVELGVDLVEVMPVNAFPGKHGWGYDGVDLYAVQEPYGGPDGFKRFVDAAHGRGLGVLLDVIYNHLGPSGNYLSDFGPYFTDTHVTPWGPAVNLDAPGSDEVRRFIVDNALMWLRDYHVDGLRLDAVHAFADSGATHLLEEIALAVDALAAHLGRPLSVVAESDLNDPRLVRSREAGGYGLTAQWCDDVHHALHATLTGERQGYYGDFGTLATLGKALTRMFVHDGVWSSFRGRSHGRPFDPTSIPGHRFVASLQNHDQIGNRAAGDRLSAVLSPGLLRIGAALLLTSPTTPMLFMGEEWGAATPWQFFTDHGEAEIATAVSKGRRREFAQHGWEPADVPDPRAPATREASVLRWDELRDPQHAELLNWYRKLIALRRSRPELTDGRLAAAKASYDEDRRWFGLQRGRTVVVANLAPNPQPVPVEGTPVEMLAASAPGFSYAEGLVELPGESVVIVALL